MRLAKFEAKPSIKRAIVKLWRARSGGFNEKIGQTRRTYRRPKILIRPGMQGSYIVCFLAISLNTTANPLIG